MLRDPRTVIIDSDNDAIAGPISFRLGRVSRPLERDANDAAWFRKGAGVVNEVGDDLRKTRIMTEDEIVGAGVPAPPGRDDRAPDGGAAPGPA